MVTVTEEGGRLYINVPQDARTELFAETPSQFFLKIRPWTLIFVKEAGRVVRLDILDSGEIVSGRRVVWSGTDASPPISGETKR